MSQVDFPAPIDPVGAIEKRAAARQKRWAEAEVGECALRLTELIEEEKHIQGVDLCKHEIPLIPWFDEEGRQALLGLAVATRALEELADRGRAPTGTKASEHSR